MRYRLRRSGVVDLEFDGTLLADQRSQAEGKPRWGEIRIYRTDTGKYVVEQVGRVAANPEMDRSFVEVVDDASGIRRVLTKRGKPNDPKRAGEVVEYLTNMALDALDEAGENDPAIADASVEVL